MFKKLLPREESFFDIFEQAADNVHEAAKALVALMENYTDVEEKAKHIKGLEHKGDDYTHQTIERLNKTFITPIDREDIHEFVCRLDDVVDLIDTAVNRMVLYKVTKPRTEAVALARVLVQATETIAKAMRDVRNMKNIDRIIRHCVDIHTAENEGDRIMQQGLAALFEGTPDPLDVIKWKDILAELESATDRCEDAANVLESIVLKNA
jgi:predicted phosphate transport protein (TIGR00153 family)